jgi:hypothetical protein
MIVLLPCWHTTLTFFAVKELFFRTPFAKITFLAVKMLSFFPSIVKVTDFAIILREFNFTVYTFV